MASQELQERIKLEARVGIEPTYKGFADLSLTTWVPRPIAGWKQLSGRDALPLKLERETGVEPATSTLARSRSTTELLPLAEPDYKQPDNFAAMSPGYVWAGRPARA